MACGDPKALWAGSQGARPARSCGSNPDPRRGPEDRGTPLLRAAPCQRPKRHSGEPAVRRASLRRMSPVGPQRRLRETPGKAGRSAPRSQGRGRVRCSEGASGRSGGLAPPSAARAPAASRARLSFPGYRNGPQWPGPQCREVAVPRVSEEVNYMRVHTRKYFINLPLINQIISIMPPMRSTAATV